MKLISLHVLEQIMTATKAHMRLAITSVTAVAVLGAGIGSSYAQMCDAELVNALKTRISNYDKLVETSTLSTHYCSSSGSNLGIDLGGMIDAVPVGASVNRQTMQKACQSKDESYLRIHHKEFEMSYLSDAALDACVGGLTYKARRTTDEQSIIVSIGYIPNVTPEFAVFESFEYPKEAVVCKKIPKKGTVLFNKSESFTCDIIDSHRDINLTLRTRKHGARTLTIPRVPVIEIIQANWSFNVGCGNMGSCFSCFNELGSFGPEISCAVSGDPCKSGKDMDGAKRKLYCAARMFSTYKVVDGKYAVIENVELPISMRPTIIPLVTKPK